MNDEELLSTLTERRALIVHCSRPGKGDEINDPLLFPDDLKNAMRIVANEGEELSCSVVWPGHTATFGSVGIILKPRSVRSITSVSHTDSGTHRDPNSGKRVGLGRPFSAEAVKETFASGDGYNEWTVTDADPVGIFVNLEGGRLLVPKLVSLMDVEGYEPSMGIFAPSPNPVEISLGEVIKTFAGMSIFSILGSEIVQIGIDLSMIYDRC